MHSANEPEPESMPADEPSHAAPDTDIAFETAMEPGPEGDAEAGRLGRSTAFFSIATGLSRVAGLIREIVAASYFGVSGVMSAFTIAFMVPNLVRSLFADAALQGAFVPIFTEQLEKGNRAEAYRLASTLIFGAILILGLITGFFILLAPVIMPLFGPGLKGANEDLMIGLSQVMFPILVLLGVSGIVVGILNSYNRFSVFAIAPFFWNVAIILVLVGLAPAFPEGDEIYAYAIGVVVGTTVQLAMVTYDLRNTPFKLWWVFDWNSKLLRRVLLLMLPVTLSLGLINFNLAINAFFGTLVSADATAAIDKAFRIYMLPQGIFSVAVATVVFPTLSRFAARRAYDDLRSTMANGMRVILLVLMPATAAILVLADPMTQLVYQRGEFSAKDTQLVGEALFWFAFSLPFNGLFLLMTRTFFSLQRPWVPTWIAGLNLVLTAGFSAAFYGPFGVAGIVASTAIATLASVIAQAWILRDQLGGLEIPTLIDGALKITLGSAVLAGVTYGVWKLLDEIFGDATIAQIISVGGGLAAGAAAYLAIVMALRVPEARQLLSVVRRR
jgi:putative peptidoglycan lipid II flippase